MAAETVEDLLVRIDVEAGRLFLVKRRGREVGAAFFSGRYEPMMSTMSLGGADGVRGCGGKRASHACSAMQHQAYFCMINHRRFCLWFAARGGFDQQRTQIIFDVRPDELISLKTVPVRFANWGKNYRCTCLRRPAFHVRVVGPQFPTCCERCIQRASTAAKMHIYRIMPATSPDNIRNCQRNVFPDNLKTKNCFRAETRENASPAPDNPRCNWTICSSRRSS